MVLPQRHQKVGESTVQVAGFYYGKVLELEEYLFRHHYLKYNLRFYWRPDGSAGSRFEEYSQAFIRQFSNVPSYQLDRNTFEAELLRRNLEDPRFRLVLSARVREVVVSEDGGRHRLEVDTPEGPLTVSTAWLVDTSGRGKLLAKRFGLLKENPIRHGAFYWWVEGLVDIDKLTDVPWREVRKKRQRRAQGHLPLWLATNHFCDEGLWFWVIPLQGKTSLGLVFEKRVVDHREVFTVERATRWVCERFPLFARDLPHRRVLDFGGLKDFSYDCQQTISPHRWALAGEAGRFTDPLYSPGSDLISIYNTLIVDAVKTDDPGELAAKCALYEQLMQAVYKAYEPTYATSYDALGDQEAFTMKYTWELTVYFAGYVFPFINDFFTDRRFALAFLRLFSQLGPVNRALQQVFSDFFHWKRLHREPSRETILFDFMDVEPLRRAERTFYEVGVTVDEGKRVLAAQVENLLELARFLLAHVASVVVEDPALLTDRRFVEEIDLRGARFDPDAIRRRWSELAPGDGGWAWSFDPHVLGRFRSVPRRDAEAAEVEVEVAS